MGFSAVQPVILHEQRPIAIAKHTQHSVGFNLETAVGREKPPITLLMLRRFIFFLVQQQGSGTFVALLRFLD